MNILIILTPLHFDFTNFGILNNAKKSLNSKKMSSR